jgi:hypothetical protein
MALKFIRSTTHKSTISTFCSPPKSPHPTHQQSGNTSTPPSQVTYALRGGLGGDTPPPNEGSGGQNPQIGVLLALEIPFADVLRIDLFYRKERREGRSVAKKRIDLDVVESFKFALNPNL